jgi:putative N6-adenine-specific DNA methylase
VSRSPTYDAFAVAAPGLAPLVAAELRELGVSPGAVDAAGVSFAADATMLYTANLHLRIATRVIVRVAAFRAAHFSDLERDVRRVPWDRWLATGSAVAVRVTSRKSRLFHTSAVAERVQGAIASRVPGVRPATVAGEDEAGAAQLVMLRLERDACTVSIDSSGDLLHRRGYRMQVGKAPLRETLAAAVLRASGYAGQCALVDPFCGSGTIPIEAALIARRIASGSLRSFAFERWPEFQRASWARAHAAATERALASCPFPIRGSDRDEGAVAAARSNAQRAGVDVDFTRRTISDVDPGGLEPGVLATNPPYGGRIGDAGHLRDLYARFGQVVRERFKGWTVAVFAADAALVRHMGLPATLRFESSNGGIRVGLWVADGAARRSSLTFAT